MNNLEKRRIGEPPCHLRRSNGRGMFAPVAIEPMARGAMRLEALLALHAGGRPLPGRGFRRGIRALLRRISRKSYAEDKRQEKRKQAPAKTARPPAIIDGPFVLW